LIQYPHSTPATAVVKLVLLSSLTHQDIEEIGDLDAVGDGNDIDMARLDWIQVIEVGNDDFGFKPLGTMVPGVLVGNEPIRTE
jgi:hypothetical protein